MYFISGVSARLFQHRYHFDIQLSFYVSSAIYNWSKWTYNDVSRQEKYSNRFRWSPSFFPNLTLFLKRSGFKGKIYATEPTVQIGR